MAPWKRGERGVSLLETAVAVALIAAVAPVLLIGLSTAITRTDDVYDRSVLFELAQTQMEEVLRQPYDPAGNYTLITTPSGFSVAVSATTTVVYTYPPPLATSTPQTIQKVTVTATGVRGSLTLEALKVRR